MKRMMLIGGSGAGKSSLINALSPLLGLSDYRPRRAMALDYHGPFVNTPGEFLENRRFYSALITTGAECDIILMLQDSTANSCVFPPNFASAFNRTLMGVITKVDCPNATPERAELFLRNAGAKDTIAVSTVSSLGLDRLRLLLESAQ